jgi:predicted ATP-binding protein involved in virulence
VVGLDQTTAFKQVIKSQENRIRSQEKRNQEQQMEIEALRHMIMEMQ